MPRARSKPSLSSIGPAAVSTLDARDALLDAAYPELVRWKAKALTPQDPQNADEFCAAHAITRDELAALTRRPSFADDVYAATVEWAKVRSPEMFHELYKDAKANGGPAAERFVKTLVEVTKKATPSQTQVNVVLAGMPDDKFARIVSRALKAPGTP